jgi:hypothetical protein
MVQRFSQLLAALCSVVAGPALASACAVCLTGAADDSVADAFNWSVLFLMATPYTVAGAIAGWLVYAKRRNGASMDGENAASVRD